MTGIITSQLLNYPTKSHSLAPFAVSDLIPGVVKAPWKQHTQKFCFVSLCEEHSMDQLLQAVTACRGTPVENKGAPWLA